MCMLHWHICYQLKRYNTLFFIWFINQEIMPGLKKEAFRDPAFLSLDLFQF
jgi:hypothetical protein